MAAIASIDYDKETKIMRVSFSRGGSRTYQDVPEDVALQFQQAGSQGSYYNANIKGQY